MNSRDKGKRGERILRDFLRAIGLTARRGQQFCGANGDADVVCEETPDIHYEMKNCEKGNPYDWIAQARRDAPNKPCHVVGHKRNHCDLIFVMPKETYERLLRGSDLVKTQNTPPAQDENGHNTNTADTER